MSGRFALGLLALPCWIACSGTQTPLVVPDAGVVRASGLAPEDLLTQRVLRVRYKGENGQLGFRLIARLIDDDHYQLSAADPLGRALWALEYDHPRLLFVDHRAGTACITSEPVTISEVALETLSLRDLPAVLVGRLPSGLATTGGGQGATVMVDAAGRRWTVSGRGASVERWTIWESGEPLLWYQATEQGGILSHRRGSQFRWRESISEKMTEPPPVLRSPDEARTLDCRDLAGTALVTLTREEN